MKEPAPSIADPSSQSEAAPTAARTARNVRWASAGAVLGAALIALNAIGCPVAFLLLSLGAGTAWIGGLSVLARYQPLFFALSAAQLGIGYYLVYWKPRHACTKDATRAPAHPNRLAKFSLWIATGLVMAAIALRYLMP